jgi:hypothetical protein
MCRPKAPADEVGMGALAGRAPLQSAEACPLVPPPATHPAAPTQASPSFSCYSQVLRRYACRRLRRAALTSGAERKAPELEDTWRSLARQELRSKAWRCRRGSTALGEEHRPLVAAPSTSLPSKSPTARSKDAPRPGGRGAECHDPGPLTEKGSGRVPTGAEWTLPRPLGPGARSGRADAPAGAPCRARRPRQSRWPGQGCRPPSRGRGAPP